MGKSEIGWCDETINPFVGCAPCSPGCDHCWAAHLCGTRLKRFYGHLVERGPKGWRFNGKVDMKNVHVPGGGSKSIFWCSHGDFFFLADDVMRLQCIAAMGRTRQHTHIIATKRLAEARRFFDKYEAPSNLVLLATICNQEELCEKIQDATVCQVRRKVLNFEPVLGPVTFAGWREYFQGVILGGESGPGARPMHQDWVRRIRDECDGVDVPFYFKQWGEYRPSGWPAGPMLRVGKKAAGHLLDGVEHRALCWEVGK